jgi:hypothetical protein
MEKIYRGERLPHGCRVVIDEDGQTRRLPMRLDLRRHSPTGFEWGYPGSGPAQLALALLADHFGDAIALEIYQEFKRTLVSRLPDSWQLASSALDAWLMARDVPPHLAKR